MNVIMRLIEFLFNCLKRVDSFWFVLHQIDFNLAVSNPFSDFT